MARVGRVESWHRRSVVVVAGAWLVVALAGGARADTVWIHATAETRGAPGEQTSVFRAFTTSDQAGTQPVPVTRLCVKGTGHQVQERCADNAASVELTENTVGLTGVGSLCVEALATATSTVGPLTATARACP